MMIVDGAKGEGGGQLFRTALTLAMCLGKSVHIKNIRAGRRKPGLLRQHLTCLLAAKEISQAVVEGGVMGSTEVIFSPQKVLSGCYRFAVGTAGSTTLIMQTLLLPLLLADGQSELVLEGGTHNPMAPTFDFIQQSFLPLLKKIGCEANVSIERYGFFPAGGGHWKIVIQPSRIIAPLTLIDRGKFLGWEACVLLSKIPEHIGLRELAVIESRCGWDKACLQYNVVSSVGPGNVVSLRAKFENITAVFDTFGEKNVRAERVANNAVNLLEQFTRADVTVCEYLADQLILPMALGQGGVFYTTKPSMHLLSNIDLIHQLSGVSIVVSPLTELRWQVVVSGECNN